MADRILGLCFLVVALAFAVSAAGIPPGFMDDPVGSKTFPYLISGIVVVCSLVFILKPDADVSWPGLRTVAKLVVTVLVLVAYAAALKPMGFLLSTAVGAGVISYQIHANPRTATISGLGLSLGLFVIFKYGLGLSLFAIPREWMG